MKAPFLMESCSMKYVLFDFLHKHCSRYSTRDVEVFYDEGELMFGYFSGCKIIALLAYSRILPSTLMHTSYLGHKIVILVCTFGEPFCLDYYLLKACMTDLSK